MYTTKSFLSTALTVTALLAGQASAQDSNNASSTAVASLTNGLSNSCKMAAAGLLASEFAACADVIQLVDVVTAQGSVVAPLNTWIKSVCSKAPCPQSVIDTSRESIQTSCTTDIQQNVPLALTLNTILTNYFPIRDVMCLQAVSNASFCITDTLSNVEKANGTVITLDQVESVIAGGAAAVVSTLNGVPTSAYCTDCGQAIFTKSEGITTNTSQEAGTAAQSAMKAKCGSAFVSGTIPPTVTEAEASNSSSSASGASGKAKSGSAGHVNLSTGVWVAMVATMGCVMGAMAVVV